MITTDVKTLKIFEQIPGRLWVGEGDKEPRLLAGGEEELLGSLLPRFGAVRLLGLKGHARLICHLWGQRLAGELDSLQVCSPAQCVRKEDSGGPEVVILRMRALDDTASRGGWHEFTYADYPSYSMCTLLHENGFAPSSAANLFLQQHPAWPLYSFLPHLAEHAAATVLASMLDPRFFISPEAPDSSSRLESYMGLSLSLVRDAHKMRREGRTPRLDPAGWPTRLGRCYALLSSWDNLARATPKEPRHFLQNVKSDNDDHRRFVACKLWLSLLRQYWLDRLVGHSVVERLFAPEHLLSDSMVVKALRAHIEEQLSRQENLD